MAKACVYLPSKGASLFKGLKRQFGYQTAKEVFLTAINPKFISDYKNTLSLDAEGVPSIESVLSNKYVQGLIGDRKLIDSISKDFTPVENTMDNYSNALESAYKFNTDSSYRDKFIATVEYADDGKIEVKISKKTDGLVNKFNNQYSTLRLNQRLVEIFSPLGVNIGTLSQAEVGAGRIGATDFSKAKSMAKDFSSMIRVANNMEGAQAVSEEFAHLIIGTLKDEPLVKRAISNLESKEEVLKEILGDSYNDTVKYYDGDMSLVAEEAVGQVLRDNLMKEHNLEKTKAPSLFKRLIQFIKNKFKQFNANDVDKAIIDVDSSMGIIAKSILNGTRQLTEDDIRKSERNVQFNALSDRVSRNIDILKGAMNVEAKRYKITKGAKRDIAKSAIDSILEYTIPDANTVEGIFNYASSALNELRSINIQFSNIDNMPPSQKFGLLRSARIYIQSYGSFINAVKDAILDEEKEVDNMFLQEFESAEGEKITLKDVIDDLNTLSEDITRNYLKVAAPAFAEFLRPFLGDNAVHTIGKNAGTKITVDELLKEANSDISYFDRWLDSMGDSSDVLLQLIDAVVKKAKDKIRLQTINNLKEIQAWRIKAEKAGVTDFEWMFEKDNKGNKSGNYISEVNYAQFEADRKAMEAHLEEKYGINPSGQDAKDKIAERNAWLAENALTVFGSPMPDPTKYRNKDYDSLSNTKKELLEEYLNIKSRLDDLYPDNRVSRSKAIQIRKSKTQRLIESATSLNSLYSNVVNAISDTFLEKEDDDSLFGDVVGKKGLTDFTGREFYALPVLFTTRLEDPNEISTDVVSALMQYAYSANTYNELDKIVDPLEVGRTVIEESRKVRQTRGNNPLVEKIDALGISVVNKVFKNDSNSADKMRDFLESHVYQRYIKDEGTVDIFGKRLNKAKLTSWLLSVSSTAQLGFNWLANIANVTQGIAMQNIEAVAGEFFNAKELLDADGIYMKELGAFLNELTSRNKTNRLSLLGELFDIKQDFKGSIRGVQKKSILERLFGSNIAFLGQECGDHWLYYRAAIAILKRYKVKTPTGTSSLYDALQIRNKFEGNNDIKEMYLPEGVTDLNDNPVDINQIGRYIAHVNQGTFGIYNEDDANAANRIALGRILLQYRKWMKPLFNKRFQAAQYSVVLGRDEEGFYRTMFRVLNELRRGQFQVAATWNNLSDHEKSNVVRALTEVAQFFGVAALVRLIEWDDDKDRPWAMKFAEYTLRRLEHELGSISPVNTVFLAENLKTLKTPAASLSIIQNSINLVNSLITPDDWTNELQSGTYKGMSTLQKNILKAPLPGVSRYRQIDRFLNDLDTSTMFYMKSY